MPVINKFAFIVVYAKNINTDENKSKKGRRLKLSFIVITLCFYKAAISCYRLEWRNVAPSLLPVNNLTSK